MNNKQIMIPKGLWGWLSTIRNILRDGLNTAGEYYDKFSKTMNTPRKVPITGTGIGYIPSMATMNDKKQKPTLQYYTTTPKQEITRTVTGMTVPTSVATIKLPVLIGGAIEGAAIGRMAKKGGKRLAAKFGANDKAQKMTEDVSGFLGGMVGGGFGAKAGLDVDNARRMLGGYKNFGKYLYDMGATAGKLAMNTPKATYIMYRNLFRPASNPYRVSLPQRVEDIVLDVSRRRLGQEYNFGVGLTDYKSAATHQSGLEPNITFNVFHLFRPSTYRSAFNPKSYDTKKPTLSNIRALSAHELKHAQDHIDGTSVGYNYKIPWNLRMHEFKAEIEGLDELGLLKLDHLTGKAYRKDQTPEVLEFLNGRFPGITVELLK